MGFSFNMTGVFIRRGKFGHSDRNTGRMPCDDRSRDGNDAAASQGPARTDGLLLQKRGRSKEGFYQSQKDPAPAGILILNFYERMTFFSLKPPSLWYFVMTALGNKDSHCVVLQTQEKSLTKGEGLGEQCQFQQKLTCNVVAKANGC